MKHESRDSSKAFAISSTAHIPRRLHHHEQSILHSDQDPRIRGPLIRQLLVSRGRRLARRPNREAALQDRRLEVLSQLPLDWVADLNALQADANWRDIRC